MQKHLFTAGIENGKTLQSVHAGSYLSAAGNLAAARVIIKNTGFTHHHLIPCFNIAKTITAGT